MNERYPTLSWRLRLRAWAHGLRYLSTPGHRPLYAWSGGRLVSRSCDCGETWGPLRIVLPHYGGRIHA